MQSHTDIAESLRLWGAMIETRSAMGRWLSLHFSREAVIRRYACAIGFNRHRYGYISAEDWDIPEMPRRGSDDFDIC